MDPIQIVLLELL